MGSTPPPYLQLGVLIQRLLSNECWDYTTGTPLPPLYSSSASVPCFIHLVGFSLPPKPSWCTHSPSQPSTRRQASDNFDVPFQRCERSGFKPFLPSRLSEELIQPLYRTLRRNMRVDILACLPSIPSTPHRARARLSTLFRLSNRHWCCRCQAMHSIGLRPVTVVSSSTSLLGLSMRETLNASRFGVIRGPHLRMLLVQLDRPSIETEVSPQSLHTTQKRAHTCLMRANKQQPYQIDNLIVSFPLSPKSARQGKTHVVGINS